MDNNNFNPNSNGNYYQNPYNNTKPNPNNQGMAIASMVCGILSICTCWCYGIVGLILAILALVFYGIHKKSNPGVKSGVATAGLVCGIVGLVLSIVSVLLFAYTIIHYDELVDEANKSSFYNRFKEFYDNAE